MSDDIVLIQISANTGPEECCLAVRKVLGRMGDDAKANSVRLNLLEWMPGRESGNFRSVLVALVGAGASELAGQWYGTVQWTCPSPYRPRHGRKNWFVGVEVFEAGASASSRGPTVKEADICFETLRAGGPGGQHVNTTDSAVRATHVPSGISVKVQTERSQYANKRLARALLSHKLMKMEQEQEADARHTRWRQHWEVERGNATRTFYGPSFAERSPIG